MDSGSGLPFFSKVSHEYEKGSISRDWAELIPRSALSLYS